MELQSILSFLIITEKFGLKGACLPMTEYERPFDTIDNIAPVYKDINDNFIEDGANVVSDGEVIKPLWFYSGKLNPRNEEGDRDYTAPRFRTYFDFTNVNRNQTLGAPIKEGDTGAFGKIGTTKAPIEVQIRIQFTEPNQDTLGVNKHRRFLRTGQLQFLVISNYDLKDVVSTREAELGIKVIYDVTRRPLFEAFKIAQYYANKYEGTDGIKILNEIDKKENGTEDMPGPTKRLLKAFENDKPNQFASLTSREYSAIFDHLFPGSGTPYERIVQEVKTLNTGVARIVNLRFAELERRTVDPIRITNPTYGLAVTIPFTFEQTR